MAKSKPYTRPGTISAANAEQAGRFLDAMYAARRKYWAKKEAAESKRLLKPASQLPLFT